LSLAIVLFSGSKEQSKFLITKAPNGPEGWKDRRLEGLKDKNQLSLQASYLPSLQASIE
jgi:hypothetical protein